VRIVAGTARGRRIEAPAGRDTRPTTDRVREAVFNALGSMDVVSGATVHYLFAGSGALGLEALSRGAAHGRVVESDRRTAEVCWRNLATLDFVDRSTVVVGDALNELAVESVDLALCDPPYAFDRWNDLLDVVRARVVVAESDRQIVPLPPWRLGRSKRYGSTFVTFITDPSSTSPE
jgi:16S rRNA (guanine966-N2)-methyltransferase